MSTFTVLAGSDSLPVDCGPGGATVVNNGPDIVYYNDERPVTASSSSIASGSSVSLVGQRFFWVPNVAGGRAQVSVVGADSSLGLEERVEAAEGNVTSLDARLDSVESGIPSALVDAKGDLLVGTAADTVARLAVGVNGQVPVADSSTASGLLWSEPSALLFDQGVTVTEDSGDATLQGQHKFTLKPRASASLTWPVPTLRPTTSNTILALDLMPKGTPAENAQNGTAWIDVCNKDIQDSGTDTAALRLGCFANHVEVGSRAFGADTPQDMWLGPAQDPTGAAGRATPQIKLVYGSANPGDGAIQVGLDGADIILGPAAPSKTRTQGHLYLSSTNGPPTGVPQFGGVAGFTALAVDYTAKKLGMYIGGAWVWSGAFA